MPNNEIKVYVTRNGDDRNLIMRYKDPNTGKPVSLSTKTSNRKQAERAAAVWEAELRAGLYKSPLKITWAEFRQRYTLEVLPGFKGTTALKLSGVFDAIERIVCPDKLSALTGERISYFVKVLRSEPTEVEKKIVTRDADGCKQVEIHRKSVTVTRAESTIKGILASLKAALNWAKRMKMLHEIPSIEMPRRAKGSKMMKGRPITMGEFERMLTAVPATDGVKAEDVDTWRWFLRGLWWSGLRLEESMNLFWNADNGLSVDLTCRRPMLRIPAEHEKGNQDRLLPMAPEFAQLLMAVPEAERIGRVFKLPHTRKDSVSKVVSAIGTRALVKVDSKRTADPNVPKVKFASAHDLRRSFGERWAARVMPQILMQLMRHESIETTMRFYVGRNAETAADALWSAMASQPSPTALPATVPENIVTAYTDDLPRGGHPPTIDPAAV